MFCFHTSRVASKFSQHALYEQTPSGSTLTQQTPTFDLFPLSPTPQSPTISHWLPPNMRILPTLLGISTALLTSATTIEGGAEIEPPTTPTATLYGVPQGRPTDVQKASPRFSCGQYKLSPGDVVQEFYSQVWAGLPADMPICRRLKFEFGDRKGEMGSMVAAKVDYGCTCWFYE